MTDGFQLHDSKGRQLNKLFFSLIEHRNIHVTNLVSFIRRTRKVFSVPQPLLANFDIFTEQK